MVELVSMENANARLAIVALIAHQKVITHSSFVNPNFRTSIV
jgi:hypothetical protein